MTDRRIDRTVSSHLAALEARVRELETVVGGGTSREIARQFDAELGTRDSATYGELTLFSTGLPGPPSPQVSVRVGQIGIIEVSLSAHMGDNDGNGAFASFALSGANVRGALDEEALFVRDAHASGSAVGLLVLACSRVVLVEDLSPGLTTVTMVYRSETGAAGLSAFFEDRELLVIPH